MRKLLFLIVILSLGIVITSCETQVTKHCRIIYDGNGTNETIGGGRPVDPNNYTSGQEAVVLNNTFIKEGHTFKHWNTHWKDTDDSYNPGDKLPITNDYFIHLYAIWELIE
ncbi:MAG: InlB B-repeat-containing protein [Treponema sp.]|nr:InlB B-repeat-containing protein [Treponema sp.]